MKAEWQAKLVWLCRGASSLNRISLPKGMRNRRSVSRSFHRLSSAVQPTDRTVRRNRQPLRQKKIYYCIVKTNRTCPGRSVSPHRRLQAIAVYDSRASKSVIRKMRFYGERSSGFWKDNEQPASGSVLGIVWLKRGGYEPASGISRSGFFRFRRLLFCIPPCSTTSVTAAMMSTSPAA